MVREGALLEAGVSAGHRQGRFGDSDDAYSLTVPGEHKDRLLLALLVQFDEDDPCAVSKLPAILEAASIPHEFDSYA